MMQLVCFQGVKSHKGEVTMLVCLFVLFYYCFVFSFIQ